MVSKHGTSARRIRDLSPQELGLSIHDDGRPIFLGRLTAGHWFAVPGEPLREYQGGYLEFVCPYCRRSKRQFHYHSWVPGDDPTAIERHGAHCLQRLSPLWDREYWIGIDPNADHEVDPANYIYRQTPPNRLQTAIENEVARRVRSELLVRGVMR